MPQLDTRLLNEMTQKIRSRESGYVSHVTKETELETSFHSNAGPAEVDGKDLGQLEFPNSDDNVLPDFEEVACDLDIATIINLSKLKDTCYMWWTPFITLIWGLRHREQLQR
jgi:hypothetical protein